jgi:hypothetical protein
VLQTGSYSLGGLFVFMLIARKRIHFKSGQRDRHLGALELKSWSDPTILDEWSATRKVCQCLAVPLLKGAVTWLCSPDYRTLGSSFRVARSGFSLSVTQRSAMMSSKAHACNRVVSTPDKRYVMLSICE